MSDGDKWGWQPTGEQKNETSEEKNVIIQAEEYFTPRIMEKWASSESLENWPSGVAIVVIIIKLEIKENWMLSATQLRK